jgi:hypothetical protein
VGNASTSVSTAHADWMKRLEDFDNSKIPVMQKMKNGDLTALRGSHNNNSPLAAADVFTVLGLKQKRSTKETKQLETQWGKKLKLKLTSQSEKAGQKFLADSLRRYGGFDTSQSGSMFHDPRHMVLKDDEEEKQTSGVHPFSAKPDLTSLAGPILFEIKPAAAAEGGTTPNCTSVLAQAVGRVFVMRSVYAHLKKIVVFAVTPASAWVVVFTRNDVHSYKRPQSSFEDVTMSAIKHKDILPLWRGVTDACKKDPSWYLTPDGPHILRFLQTLGCNPRTCITKLHAASSSRVYTVSLPSMYRYPRVGTKKGASVVGALRQKPDFCIKVVLDDDKFKGELSAVMAVKDRFNQQRKKQDDPLFYMLGGWSCAVEPSSQKKRGRSQDFETISNATSIRSSINRGVIEIVHDVSSSPKLAYNWMSVENTRKVGGGCFAMRLGRAVHGVVTEAMANGICTTLRACQEAGVYHCDIRKSNVLEFENGHYQLIDFDHAVPADASRFVLQEGGQLESLGPRLVAGKHEGPGSEVEWGGKTTWRCWSV